MRRTSKNTVVLILGLLFLVSDAYGITATFGGRSGGSSSGISETLSTNPDGSFFSTSTYGTGATLLQNNQINGMDYGATKFAYSNYGDYAKVTYTLKNAVLGSDFSASASNMGSYAIATETWNVISADSIEFSAYARNRKNYEAKVTTNIEDGGVDFTNEAKATYSTAIATQALSDAWGDKIKRDLSSNNKLKYSAHYSIDSFDYSGEPPKYDYEDTATATKYDATVTPTGGPESPSPPSPPGIEIPVIPTPYQPPVWPVGLGW